MKKNMIFALALGLTLASCSQVDMNTTPNTNPETNPNAINFGTATTRAEINNLTSMQASATGFKVYATNNGVTNDWADGVNGTNNYKYTSAWGWATTAPNWPTGDGSESKYPMTFYAYYPDLTSTDATDAGFAPSVTQGSKLEATITVPADITKQIDFLAAKETTGASKPQTGFVSMVFEHIMSKVSFKITQATAKTTYINQLGFKNIINKGTYNYMNEAWGALVPADLGSYDYVLVNDQATEVVGDGNAKDLRTDNHFFMFVPQATTAIWDGSGSEPEILEPAAAYIAMEYRTAATAAPKKDEIGFALRETCIWDTKWTQTGDADNVAGWKKYALASTDDTKYTGPLYIKVGFKMDRNQLSWENGKGYSYNMLLAQAGGYYLSKYYYDEDGNNTKIEVNGGSVDPTDPVYGNEMMFTVDVTDWVEETPSTPGV